MNRWVGPVYILTFTASAGFGTVLIVEAESPLSVLIGFANLCVAAWCSVRVRHWVRHDRLPPR